MHCYRRIFYSYNSCYPVSLSNPPYQPQNPFTPAYVLTDCGQLLSTAHILIRYWTRDGVDKRQRPDVLPP